MPRYRLSFHDMSVFWPFSWSFPALVFYGSCCYCIPSSESLTRVAAPFAIGLGEGAYLPIIFSGVWLLLFHTVGYINGFIVYIFIDIEKCKYYENTETGREHAQWERKMRKTWSKKRMRRVSSMSDRDFDQSSGVMQQSTILQ